MEFRREERSRTEPHTDGHRLHGGSASRADGVQQYGRVFLGGGRGQKKWLGCAERCVCIAYVMVGVAQSVTKMAWP